MQDKKEKRITWGAVTAVALAAVVVVVMVITGDEADAPSVPAVRGYTMTEMAEHEGVTVEELKDRLAGMLAEQTARQQEYDAEHSGDAVLVHDECCDHEE